MSTHRDHGEKLFRRHYHQVERLIEALAARKRLSPDERQELHSLVMLKLIEDDYRVLRGFKGKSTWTTYLQVVIGRVLLDHRIKEWGRWRPCAEARRLGSTAIQLDRRINRDGLEPAEAIQELLVRGVEESAAELESLAQRLPRRPRRQLVPAEAHVRTLASPEAADQRIEIAERQSAAAEVSSALNAVLEDLPDHERYLLGMRFGQGFTIRRIAANENLNERSLYRRFARILRGLRQRLEHLGVGWNDVSPILAEQDADVEIEPDSTAPIFRPTTPRPSKLSLGARATAKPEPESHRGSR